MNLVMDRLQILQYQLQTGTQHDIFFFDWKQTEWHSFGSDLRNSLESASSRLVHELSSWRFVPSCPNVFSWEHDTLIFLLSGARTRTKMKMTEGILQLSIYAFVLPLLSSLPEDGSASWQWVPKSPHSKARLFMTALENFTNLNSSALFKISIAPQEPASAESLTVLSCNREDIPDSQHVLQFEGF